MTEKIILFIGSGSGLADPNFGQLMKWLGEKYGAYGARHYLLLPEGTHNPAPGLPFNVVRCAGFEDQNRWLKSLLGKAAVRDGTIAEIPKRSKREFINKWLRPVEQTQVIRANIDRLRVPYDLIEATIGEVWNEDRSSLVSIRGRRGFGKTMLCSSVIESTRRACRLTAPDRARDSLTYFLCDSETYGFSVFCRTVIDQLCPPEKVFPALDELYTDSTRYRPVRAPTAAQLREVLIQIIAQLCPNPPPVAPMKPAETYLIIDGLDHVKGDDRDLYLKLINDIIDRDFQHFHLLVSPNLRPRVRNSLRLWDEPDQWDKIVCDGDAIENAIHHHVVRSIDADPQLQPLSPAGDQAAMGNQILVGLVDGASQRGFDWLDSKIEALKRLNDFTDVEQIIRIINGQVRQRKRRRV
ncbi:hypothetical protein GGR53DRAFT_463446 [Hypoxylon sp. FL1150]|nr:hypothetical protein GGR53DRAFT_463446 [Hypoxylon sp. FL1150]